MSECGFIIDDQRFTREKALKLIWRHTHRDYKGTLDDGTKTILVSRNGTCIVALNDLTDAEILDHLKYAVHKEAMRKGKV